jgi:large subunit ribosomal protein L21
MFAIIETGGKQYKVEPGTAIDVERLESEPGSTIEFDRVLMVSGDDGQVEVGKPYLAGTKVVAHVLKQGRGEKIIVFRYKAKSNYRRRTGHRQAQTRVRVAEIVGK